MVRETVAVETFALAATLRMSMNQNNTTFPCELGAGFGFLDFLTFLRRFGCGTVAALL
jgi:hypothetical protein